MMGRVEGQGRPRRWKEERENHMFHVRRQRMKNATLYQLFGRSIHPRHFVEQGHVLSLFFGALHHLCSFIIKSVFEGLKLEA